MSVIGAMPMPDYSNFAEPPSLEDLRRLDLMIESLVEAKERGNHSEYERLSQKVLPPAMLDLGLQEHTTSSGTQVALQESPHGRVRAERRPELYAWLQSHGHEEVLSKVRGPFKSGSAQRRAEQVHLHPLALTLLKSGQSLPLELLGLSRTHIARILNG